MICAAAACPNALCPARDWQGLVAAALTSFSFPKNGDFRAYLLQTSAAFQRFPGQADPSQPHHAHLLPPSSSFAPCLYLGGIFGARAPLQPRFVPHPT